MKLSDLFSGLFTSHFYFMVYEVNVVLGHQCGNEKCYYIHCLDIEGTVNLVDYLVGLIFEI